MWNVHYFTFSMNCWNLLRIFQQGNLVGDEGNGIVNLYLCARCRATMYLACGTVEVNNVKNICVLKDSICQGGRPKNSRTCMLVGSGSRHLAAEAMELKVPAKVLICNFVLPTGVSILRYSNISILIKYSIFGGFYKKTQMWQVWALINLLAVPEKVFTTGDDRQVHCDESYDTQGFTVYILNYRVILHGMSHIC